MSGTERPTVFVSSDYRYVCDTCEPLKDAIARDRVKWVGFKRGQYPGCTFESEELAGLRLLAYWDAQGKQDWGLNYHRNEGLEIGYVENGSAEFSSARKSGKFETLTPEFVAVTKPWQEHTVGNPHLDACKMYFLIIDFGIRRPNQEWKWPPWILLSEGDRREFADYMSRTERTVFHSTPEIKDVFAKIGKILSSENMFDISKLSVLINRMVLELLQIFRGEALDETHTEPSENVVRLFIEQLPTYCAKEWTLELMAEDCGLKPSRFAYYCRKIANSTPKELLNSARLERAKEMIRNLTDTPITDIAMNCGFASSQYFATKFKDAFEISPKDFRTRCRAED